MFHYQSSAWKGILAGRVCRLRYSVGDGRTRSVLAWWACRHFLTGGHHTQSLHINLTSHTKFTSRCSSLHALLFFSATFPDHICHKSKDHTGLEPPLHSKYSLCLGRFPMLSNWLKHDWLKHHPTYKAIITLEDTLQELWPTYSQ